MILWSMVKEIGRRESKRKPTLLKTFNSWEIKKTLDGSLKPCNLCKWPIAETYVTVVEGAYLNLKRYAMKRAKTEGKIGNEIVAAGNTFQWNWQKTFQAFRYTAHDEGCNLDWSKLKAMSANSLAEDEGEFELDKDPYEELRPWKSPPVNETKSLPTCYEHLGHVLLWILY